jgi:pimeloyl-ACP methyl ester carboxylesterase
MIPKPGPRPGEVVKEGSYEHTEGGRSSSRRRPGNRDAGGVPRRHRDRCWSSGEGPPLVVVHGTPAGHSRWRPLLPYLEPHGSVHAMDRRGRGASGDAPGYDLAREYEDVAAVVDAVAEASGAPVDLYGHSHGGIVAFGAAMLTSNIGKLVLYEGWPVPNPDVYALPPGLEDRMDALLAPGDRPVLARTRRRRTHHHS